MYILKNLGDKIPHCLTPFDTFKAQDAELPHRTVSDWVLYQKANILTMKIGILSNNNQ
jgi:hypothetical protein